VNERDTDHVDRVDLVALAHAHDHEPPFSYAMK
jgi:hypothetical protein